MASQIYKILSEALWQASLKQGYFSGAPVDLADGYIHFSTIAQLRETARKHFHGQSGLMLAEIDADRLGDNLKYEPSRGGDLFPHLYGILPLDAVVWVKPLPVDADGAHQFPEDIA
ncbi:DUF952 domain-containing protein [Allorhizobium undicola]|uniref:DUF952 domain-containing protein n=1 Tax=Allorhizobium undicola TaxID=78527 RepID=UPI003D35734E